MVNSFLGEAEHERVRVEFTTERGRQWCSMPVEKDGDGGRSSVEWRRRGIGHRQSSWWHR
jgi:hypothetical protein